jgi:hypothetical protein
MVGMRRDLVNAPGGWRLDELIYAWEFSLSAD